MSVNANIPKIAITPGSEDEDDRIGISVTEALTDIEVLDEETPRKNIGKHKLKIKLTEESGATDVEDLAASDSDEDNSLDGKPESVSLDNLNLEEGTIEELIKMQEQTASDEKEQKTQISVQINTKQPAYKIDNIPDIQCFTDEENFDTDSELQEIHSLEKVPQLDNTDDWNVTEKIHDCPNLPHSLENTSNSSSTYTGIRNLSTFLNSPDHPEFTDVEILNSDSNDEQDNQKNTCRRRRRKTNRKLSNSDAEDPEHSKYTNVTKSQSLTLFDSDKEDGNLLFPVCKIVQPKLSLLKVSNVDENFLTDSEEIETELDDRENDISPTGSIKFEEELNEIVNDYCQETCTSVKKNLPKKQPNRGRLISQNYYQTKDSDSDEVNEKLNLIFSKMDFPRNLNKYESEHSITHSEVTISSSKQTTDGADSVDQKLTDEEQFAESDSDTNYPTPELNLPSPNINFIISKDNDLFSTVQILPLHDELPNKLADIISDKKTDEESFSDEENSMNNGQIKNVSRINDSAPLLEGGSVTITQDSRKSNKLLMKPQDDMESVTDTEELFIESKNKRRRAPKFKHIFGHLYKKPPANELMLLTDTEDLYISDGNVETQASHLALLQNPNEPLTDVENLGDSSEEDYRSSKLKSPPSTPIHMSEMGSGSTVSKEEFAPFSIKDRIDINKDNKVDLNTVYTPMNTDTEEIDASADEGLTGYSRAETATPNQIHTQLDQMSSTSVHAEVVQKFNEDPSGVMYLKGGGYVERNTDVEYISDGEKSNTSGGTCKKPFATDFRYFPVNKYFFSVHDESTSFGLAEEWDASRKPAEPESKTLGKDAAQQGKTTSTTHYLASNEEIPLIENSTEFISPKPIYDQINALIQSESRAEPFHIHTERHYNVKPSEDEKHDRSQTDSIKEEKKKKKGIFGTIKTFVGKSLDHSDSEPEKSPKKERKHKKDKARKKTADDELPPEVPSRPPRKPKLPTPTEDRKFADIPYFEASPSDAPPFYKSHENISPEKDATTRPNLV
ncbi:hypothetical protein NQ318_012280 [Aromia moschata]|uniref:Uncharacterized protein n=1 Tax=Aromia moschata TaxID=1265417 RepID=A0AAV8YJX3_9CUCU|nr:hypothetical protein NQ318_012280 [Aromia moschata]